MRKFPEEERTAPTNRGVSVASLLPRDASEARGANEGPDRERRVARANLPARGCEAFGPACITSASGPTPLT
eukprot:4233368-Pyramimonas_sp.AAC.1